MGCCALGESCNPSLDVLLLTSVWVAVPVDVVVMIHLRHRPAAAVLLGGLVASRFWSVSSPDLVGWCWGGEFDCWAGPWSFILCRTAGLLLILTDVIPELVCVRTSGVDSCSMEVAACPYSWGLTLLRCNVVNWAESETQVG